jgi:hypothetical protein
MLTLEGAIGACPLCPIHLSSYNSTAPEDKPMAEPTFETLLEKTFADLKKRREDLRAKKAEIEQELMACERDYRRFQTAQEALEGRFDQLTKAPRKPRESGEKSTRAPRGERGRLMREFHEFIRTQMPTGATSDAVAVEFQKTDKKGRDLVANILSRMKAEGYLTHSGVKGSAYKIGPTPLSPLPSDEEAA